MKPSKRSSRRQPHQTRLSFTPLPSSSPAAVSLSSDVRNRAAAADYVGSPSPSKRRKIAGDTHAAGGTNHLAIPTSEQSSQLRSSTVQSAMAPQVKHEPGRLDSSSDSDDMPVPRSQRKHNTFLNSSRKKDQKKIAFVQPNKTSPAVKREESNSSQEVPEGSSSSEDIPTRKRTQPVTPKSTKKSKRAESPKESPPSSRRETRLSKKNRRGRGSAASFSGDESEGLEIVDRPSNAQGRDPDFGEPESSGDDALASSPGSIPKKKKSKKAVEVHSEEESEEELPVSAKKRKRKRAAVSEEDSEDEIPVSSRKRKAPPVSGSDEDDELVTQRMRRRSPSAVQQEKEDLAEDLEFLGSSPRKLDLSRRPRSAARPMNARQKALEALKRRRAGEKDASSEDEEEAQPRRRRALYDTETESESKQEEPGEDEDEDALPDEPHDTVRQATTLDMFQEDDDDENFVIEDDEDTLGVPDEDARIPLAFSSMSRAKGKDLFKYAVEWMVQKKLNPGFAKDDDIYRLAFRKLTDEVNGLAGSRFKSSAWTRDFTRALNARPIMDAVEIGGSSRLLLDDHCGACNRKSHPATWNIQFSGKAYRVETLSDVEEDSSDSDEEDDDSDDSRSVDANGHSLPSESTVFHVGVYCKNNAETAHTLMHWRWHLFDWIKDYLKSQGHLDPAKIVERDGWKTKKKMKYANRVVDKMQESGEIKRLYQDFKATTDAAREAKLTRWNRYGL